MVGSPRLEHFKLDGDNNYHSIVTIHLLYYYFFLGGGGGGGGGAIISMCVYIQEKEKEK
jgi:hypothetical protein